MSQDTNHTILCIDDEQNILSSLKRLLRREGYQLLTTTSGSEAFKLLEENHVHLIISDQRMPEMNGTDFLAQVKDQLQQIYPLDLLNRLVVEVVL